MGADFLFVQVSESGKVAPDKALRRKIQKQAMKETAVKRRQRSARQQAPPARGDETKQHAHPPFGMLSIPSVPGGNTRVDPFVMFPVPASHEISFLVDHIYTCPYPWARPFRDVWFPLSLSDPAFFYEVLSYASRQVNGGGPKPDVETRAMRFHSLAVRSVNERLSTVAPFVVDDGIIGTILAFTCFSYFRQSWDEYEAHLRGLLAIVKFKGGANALNHNMILRLLLSGVDVLTSCFQGRPPNFPLPLKARHDWHQSSQELPWWLPVSGGDDETTNVWHRTFPSDDRLGDLFQDLATIVMVMRQESNRRLLWQDKTFVVDNIDPLSYRLLQSTIDSEDVDATNFVSESCRLGALVLLGKIRRRFESRLVFTGIETRKLRRILQVYERSWVDYRHLLLWACVMAAVEVAEEEKVWFCDLIGRTARLMGLASWDEVVAMVSNLIWVGGLLDEEAELLRPLVAVQMSDI